MTNDKTDFFESQYGNYYDLPIWRQRNAGRVVDLFYDARLKLNQSYRGLLHSIDQAPVRDVLLVGVEVPARAQDLQAVFSELKRTRHRITAINAPLLEGKGKFQNINACLQDLNINDYDWLLVIDDDITVPHRFLDKFIYLAEKTALKLCQPAHLFHSYQYYAITQRVWNSLPRTTHYVECGSVTAFHRDLYPFVLPFADLRWAWGNDVVWAERARNNDLRIGIIDGTPIEHLRPVAVSYSSKLARLEGDRYLDVSGVTRSRSDILKTVDVISKL